MMITLEDPWLSDALAHGAPDGMIVDWLIDQDATLGDMALLFAGTPPLHTDGVTQSILALWLDSIGSPSSAVETRKIHMDARLFSRTVSMDRDVQRALLVAA